jgi:hypothetical protein
MNDFTDGRKLVSAGSRARANVAGLIVISLAIGFSSDAAPRKESSPAQVKLVARQGARSGLSVSVQVTVTNCTKSAIAVTLPLLCSYRYTVVRNSPLVVHETSATSGEISDPSSSLSGLFRCGPWMGRDCMVSSARITIPASGSVEIEDTVPYGPDTKIMWQSDDLTLDFELPQTWVSCKGRCDKPLGFSVHFPAGRSR